MDILITIIIILIIPTLIIYYIFNISIIFSFILSIILLSILDLIINKIEKDKKKIPEKNKEQGKNTANIEFEKLFKAIDNFDIELIRKLINSSNINQNDKNGNTPLIFAMLKLSKLKKNKKNFESINKLKDIIRILYANGANIYLENNYGYSAYSIAIDIQDNFIFKLFANGINSIENQKIVKTIDYKTYIKSYKQAKYLSSKTNIPKLKYEFTDTKEDFLEKNFTKEKELKNIYIEFNNKLKVQNSKINLINNNFESFQESIMQKLNKLNNTQSQQNEKINLLIENFELKLKEQNNKIEKLKQEVLNKDEQIEKLINNFNSKLKKIEDKNNKISITKYQYQN